MPHTYSRSTCKQCSNNPVNIRLLSVIPLSMARACIREELTSKFRDDIRDLMDLWETQMGVAPLDNAVNTKGTRPGANPCVHATRRLCASNTFFSGERGYARSHPSPQTRTTNTQGGGRGGAMGGSGVGGGSRGWRNTNTSANFGLLYACWELAGPESERERGLVADG